MRKLTVEANAATEFERLPVPIQIRILQLYERLRKWPAVSGAKPLRGSLAGKYRLRTGDYRVQFRVTATDVIVEKLGHRDRFYDDKD